MKKLAKPKKMPKKISSESRTFSGIDYTLDRKRITRLHIYIKPPDGEVLVTAPVRMPLSKIEGFIRDRADWIRKHSAKFRERPAQAKMSLEYKTGDILYFWGVPYRLEVISCEERKKGGILIDPYPVFRVSDSDLLAYRTLGHAVLLQAESAHGTVILQVPRGSGFEQRENIVKRKYKELLEAEAERVLNFWSDMTGLRYSSWHVRYMKTRWGSLTLNEKRVCLNTRLAEKPEVCLVYVALHEIAHVKEPNHGQGFKAILDRYMPCWREAEKIMKS